jgi:hypothetical protein
VERLPTVGTRAIGTQEGKVMETQSNLLTDMAASTAARVLRALVVAYELVNFCSDPQLTAGQLDADFGQQIEALFIASRRSPYRGNWRKETKNHGSSHAGYSVQSLTYEP